MLTYFNISEMLLSKKAEKHKGKSRLFVYSIFSTKSKLTVIKMFTWKDSGKNDILSADQSLTKICHFNNRELRFGFLAFLPLHVSHLYLRLVLITTSGMLTRGVITSMTLNTRHNPCYLAFCTHSRCQLLSLCQLHGQALFFTFLEKKSSLVNPSGGHSVYTCALDHNVV